MHVMLNIDVHSIPYRSNSLKPENYFLFSHSFGLSINISANVVILFILLVTPSIVVVIIMQIIHDEWRTYLLKQDKNKPNTDSDRKQQFCCANCEKKWMNWIELNRMNQQQQQQNMMIKLNVNKIEKLIDACACINQIEYLWK